MPGERLSALDVTLENVPRAALDERARVQTRSGLKKRVAVAGDVGCVDADRVATVGHMGEGDTLLA
jgi:hypothetical protein